MAVAQIKVVGNSEDMYTFFRLLAYVNHLCESGASRTINLVVDGDGSANFSFFQMVGENAIPIEFTGDGLKQCREKVRSGSDIKIYLGE